MKSQKYQNVSVDEYTSPVSHFATKEMKVSEIYKMMDEKGFRHIPVLNEKSAPIGIISERDIHLLNAFTGDQLMAHEIMADDPYCVPVGSSLEHVAFEMSQRKIGSTLVVNEKGELDGIFTSTDALNALIEVIRGRNL